jgi:extracellular elastinolytic metalloproteinase
VSRKTPSAFFIALTALAFFLPSTSGLSPQAGASSSGAHSGLEDVDARQGAVSASAEQQQIVSELGARVDWNDFGTPKSLSKDGGYLDTGLTGPDAAAAARRWISSNSALFRLSSADDLELVNDSRLLDSKGHAVLFQQDFGGLKAAEDGMITVGVVGTPGSGWKIAYSSSSLTGDTAVTGSTNLSPTEAWLKAAADIGRSLSASDIIVTKTDRDWTILGVRGLSNVQRVRLVALPTPENGVRRAYETIYLDSQSGNPVAYLHYIDADTGRALMRKNLVEQSHPPADNFSGAVPMTDGACAQDNGPWTVTSTESVGSIVVSVEATLTVNDSVIHLVRDGNVVASQDTLFSPEVLVYDPLDGGQGTYHVRVCDFGDQTPWVQPNTYSGQIIFNPANAQAGFPYPPKWKVFPAYPGLGNEVFPWNNPSTDIREIWCWESTVGFPPVTLPECDREVQNLASRVPWDFNARTNTPTFTTSGNNAISAEAWTSPLTPGPPGQRPFSPTREYIYDWDNKWHTVQAGPPPPGCSETNLVPTGNDIDAAVTNLFAMHNRMHDWSYFLGFTERRWNAQDSNFGTGGTAEGDPLIGNAQAGAVDGGFPTYLGRDNANMVPLPDGVPPTTNMYLWQPLAGAFYAPCVDGDYDMAVIGHEFSHLTENRMIGKGGTRGGHHAGAMGESFADFAAAEYLNEYGFVPVSGENPFAVGAYVTGNKERAIRNYNMSYARTGAFPEPNRSTTGSGTAGMKVNPLNFSNHGYDITGAQVHADGEIWSAVNFDIRQALVSKYNAAFPASNQQLQRDCADGKRPADQCPGNRRWIQIVHDAMLLMPVAPSMLNARDAYLAADMMRFGGANQNELWLAFARRGFGQFATSTNAASNQNDADPKPDFASPNHGEAAVTFRAVASNEGNVPVNARVYVGHYEARVSPIAVTGTPASGSPSPDTSNVDNRALFVPGTYEFVAHAPGYGHVRFRETFSAGQNRTVTIQMPTNWASSAKGALATGSAGTTQAANLIDDTEVTNWDDPPGGGPVNTTNPSVTVDLVGTAARTINRVQVSALLEVGQNRFTPVRQFRVETSTNGVIFSPWFTSASNAFPGFNPRPVAPEMILRNFAPGSSRQATHVRIVVLHNQCTGNADFQGEQDNDPLNPTDCRFGNPSSSVVPVFGDLPQVLAERQDEVHITELQVFSSAGGTGGGDNGGGDNGGGDNGGGDNGGDGDDNGGDGDDNGDGLA